MFEYIYAQKNIIPISFFGKIYNEIIFLIIIL